MRIQLALISAALLLAACSSSVKEGPCDIYIKGGTTCVAAHSTTRVLYSKYKGPLYQVKRASDGATIDICATKDGYADAAAQDSFLGASLGYITVIYDQSGNGNDLVQASPGTFKGPDKGEFNTLPIADMAPVVLNGHKVYGAYFMPGMGLRNNNAKNLAINDEPEGIYYVIDGTHYDSGCCFDYGNSSTNGKAVGRGTMETTYYGTATAWGTGNGDGPWIMSDMEAGLFSGWNAKQNDVPSITGWRFVSVYVNGGGADHWDLRGADATSTEVVTYYDGVRPESNDPDPAENYYPMHKKGGLLLANGGDNGNGSAGTFYEGVMTFGYPSEATVKAVQANIAAEKYAEQTMAMSRLKTFKHGESKEVSVSFRNPTDAAIADLDLALELPEGWSSTLLSKAEGSIAPGQSAVAIFNVTAADADAAGLVRAVATWNGGSEFAQQRVRSAAPVRINELGLSSGQFIELYNTSDESVDLSGYQVEITRSGWAPVMAATLPEGSTIGPKDYLVLRPSAEAEASDQLPITTIFTPVSTGPWLEVPAGSTSLPLTSVAGLEVGQTIGVDAGGKYEQVTITSVGTAGTQTILAEAAKAGDTVIKLEVTADLREGMEIIISTGQRKEVRKVKTVLKSVAAPQRRFGQPQEVHVPGEIELDQPLTIDQMAKVDVSSTGSGIEFTPALKYAHKSGEAVEVLIASDATAAVKGNAPAHTLVSDGSHYGYSFAPKAGAVALYHGDVLIDAIIYGSKQSSSSANGTIARPDLAVLEGDQAQGGCIAEVPMSFWYSASFRPTYGEAPAMPMRRPGMGSFKPMPCALVRIPDGMDNDSMCEIQNTVTPTPGAANVQTQQ